jgi:hypothetical protein
MVLLNLGIIGTTIMRSTGDPGQVAYNVAGNALVEKPTTTAVTANDHFKLLPPPPPPPAPAPLQPTSPTTGHDMVNDNQIAGVAALKSDFVAGNDTVFLPFKANVISSAVLAGGAGPSYFFTAELSGCSIFIDRDPASGHVIVYHANAMGLSPNAQAVQANWMAEWSANPHLNYMVPLYNMAHTSYLGAYPGLVAAGQLHKLQYGATIQQEIRRKAQMDRSKVGILWGTNVFGVRNGAQWAFSYQTFGGLMEYERPFYAPKRWTDGKDVRGRGTVQVWDSQQFCVV